MAKTLQYIYASTSIFPPPPAVSDAWDVPSDQRELSWEDRRRDQRERACQKELEREGSVRESGRERGKERERGETEEKRGERRKGKEREIKGREGKRDMERFGIAV